MITSRRGFLTSTMAAMGVSAFASKAEALTMPARVPITDTGNESFIDIDNGQREYLGEEFVNSLTDTAPNRGFIFININTFARLESFLRETLNPFSLGHKQTASQYDKDVFTAQVLEVINDITENRPHLRQYLHGFTDINEMIAFCQEQAAYSRIQAYHFIRDYDHTPRTLIVNVPTVGFNHQEFLSFSLGLAYNQTDVMFPGTSRDWARFITIHEVGHSEEDGAPESRHDGANSCIGRMEQIGFERIGDRFCLQHFRAENETDTQKINDIWRLYRAAILHRNIDTNMYLEGRIVDSHTTALDWVPERHNSFISNVATHGAYAAAASMVRTIYTLLETMGIFNTHSSVDIFSEDTPVARMLWEILNPNEEFPTLPPRIPINIEAPQEMIRHTRTVDIGIDIFAGITAALVERGAFRDMPLAHDAASLYVEAIHTLMPNKINDAYERVRVQVMGLPDETIATLARYVRRVSAEQNYCTILPPPPPRPVPPQKVIQPQ